MNCSHESSWIEIVAPALVALVIGGATICLSWLQIGISKQQAAINEAQKNIAAEKLRHDLFDRRYAIYSAFLELLSAVANINRLPEQDMFILFGKANHQRGVGMFLLNSHLTEYLSDVSERCFANYTMIQQLSRETNSEAWKHRPYNERKEVAEELKRRIDERTAFIDEGNCLHERFAPFFKAERLYERDSIGPLNTAFSLRSLGPYNRPE